MKTSTTELAAATAAGIVAGVVGLRLWQSRQAASPAVPAAPGALPLAQGVAALTGAVTITLQPGIASLQQALDVNTAVILYLPEGGKWQSVDGAGITDRTSPQAFVFHGPISHVYAWTDASNTAQLVAIDFNMAAPPVVSA